jgi:hypothetical protein
MLDEKFWEEQRNKFKERLQNQIDEDFARTHDLIMKNLTPKDKGTMRNINNYRMKLWCDMFIEYKKNSFERSLAADYATKDLKMFDIQFNQ